MDPMGLLVRTSKVLVKMLGFSNQYPAKSIKFIVFFESESRKEICPARNLEDGLPGLVSG